MAMREQVSKVSPVQWPPCSPWDTSEHRPQVHTLGLALSVYSSGLKYKQRFQWRSYGKTSRRKSFGAVMSGSRICSHQRLNFFLWLERHDLRCAVTPGLSLFSSPEVQEKCHRKPGANHTNRVDSSMIFLSFS